VPNILFLKTIQMPIQILKKTGYMCNFLFISSLLLFFSFFSCSSNCPENKQDFQNTFSLLIHDISTVKRTKNDNDWDLIDKKFRRLVNECYPKFSSEMDEAEKLLFWENAMGYTYVRFGNDLLKKFGKSDLLIVKIKDSLDRRQILIGPAVKRLCREWPVLYGYSEKEITSQIKRAMEIQKKKSLLDFKKDSLN
jgi:hypothetical protein